MRPGWTLVGGLALFLASRVTVLIHFLDGNMTA